MTQKEILEHEDDLSIIIFLYQEGMFWKAYEYSAYRFVFGINEFKASKKYVKAVNGEVISIGFPVTSLDKFAELFDVVASSEKQMTVTPRNFNPEVSFKEWKHSVVLNEMKPKTVEKMIEGDLERSLINEIRNFNLESKTPMECMIWLSQLKKRING